MADLETYFVSSIPDSTNRRFIFDAFNNYMNQLLAVLNAPVEVWVGGSFTTQKLNPNDIDFVIFVDTQVVRQHSETIQQFRAKRQNKDVVTDGYFAETVPVDHHDYRIYQFNRTDWFRDFAFDRLGNHKGILQLFFAKDERAINP